MKKSLLCAMTAMSLSVSATSFIHPQVEIEGVTEIDQTISCVDGLESASQVGMSQNFALMTHRRNLSEYGVDELMKSTPKIKEFSQKLLSDYGISLNFNRQGLSDQTRMSIRDHEKKAEIISLYREFKEDLNKEFYSVNKLANRNVFSGYGGFGFPGVNNFEGSTPVGSGAGIGIGYGMGPGTLDIYFDIEQGDEDSNIELQYEAKVGDFSIKSATDANDESKDMAPISSVIDVESVGYEISMTNPYSNYSGGWGMYKYRVVDAETGQEVINTQSAYEVCRKINAKKSRVFDASISTTELTPEKDGEFILTGGDATGATVTLE